MTVECPPQVEFIEDKRVEPETLAELLRPAVERNRHSNFGPVSRRLEGELARRNRLSAGRAACCAANATLALQAMVAVLDNRAGRRLRWAVSDFGFFTNFIGPFAGQTVVPCDDNGMISVDALAALPDRSFDAVLATNVFGMCENFEAIFAFCRARGKVLLIDNAAGFGALSPWQEADAVEWAEVVSFHHTKPWGMGEGGAAFLPAEWEEPFRASINFGAGGGRRLADPQFLTNGKMSEIAAAQILDRVLRADDWRPRYRAEAARIVRLGCEAGLQPWFPALPERAVPGNIPFLHERAVRLEDLGNPLFTMLKYYQPTVASGAVARRLFDHVINVPCHPGMGALRDAEIVAVLRGVGRRQ